jgi:hypothetical protein
MGNSAGMSFWYAVDLRRPDAPVLLRHGDAGPAACRKRPLYNAKSWGRPPAFRVRVPTLPVPAEDFTPVLDAFGPPTNRVGLWIVDVVPDQAVLPSIDIELSSAPGIGDTFTTQVALTKGLGTLKLAPLWFELQGVSALEWQLRARISAGPDARTVRVGFGLLGGRSKCSGRHIIAP